MIAKEYSYSCDGKALKGFIAYDETQTQTMPAVLIAHDWTGCNEFSREKAIQIASLGYVGFAVDMYGDGSRGETNDEKMALMSPLLEDRHLLSRRINAALSSIASELVVNEQKIAVIGYCFGGLVALDLARSGADINAAVSFHGLLNAPEQTLCSQIKAKVLVLHGYDDPMVSSRQLTDFASEMTEAKVDWQLHSYGRTLHAFTNPLASDKELGTVYNKTADKRSWQACVNFLRETLI